MLTCILCRYVAFEEIRTPNVQTYILHRYVFAGIRTPNYFAADN